MRILLSYPNSITELLQGRPLPGSDGDEILCFGGEYAAVPRETWLSWPTILESLPAGWVPELYIHWSPEYNPLPLGLEEASCPLVGVFGDWNLGGHALRAIGDLFDILAADAGGAALFKQQGYQRVLPAQLWGYRPELHRLLNPISGPERDIDLLLIGNLNGAIHPERARWLGRIARLSTRHRVEIATGVHGEEYVRLMNRARAVFNFSVRGEINMRAYEAPACGALLFQEACCREIGSLYENGVHCVLYTEETLAPLLDRYLAPEREAERASMVEAARRRMAACTYAGRLRELVAAIRAELTRQPVDVLSRGLLNCSPAERAQRMSLQWLKSVEPQALAAPTHSCLVTDRAASGTALGGRPSGAGAPPTHDPESKVRNRLAWPVLPQNLTLAYQAERARAAAGAQRPLFLQALAAARAASGRTGSLPARWTSAGIAGMLGDTGRAREEWSRLADELDAPGPASAEDLAGPFFPRVFGPLDVALEAAWAHCAPGTKNWTAAVAPALKAHARSAAAELAWGHSDYADACRQTELAVAAAPRLAGPRRLYARSLCALGRCEEALEQYAVAVELDPLDSASWLERARLEMDLGSASAAQTLTEWRAILEAVQPLHPLRAETEALLREAGAAAARQNGEVARLLAVPAWQEPASWQPVVAGYVERFRPDEAVVLMLRADPDTDPPADSLAARVSEYLARGCRRAAQGVPAITLLTERLARPQLWKAVEVSSALVSGQGSLPEPWLSLAAARGRPVGTVEQVAAKLAKRSGS